MGVRPTAVIAVVVAVAVGVWLLTRGGGGSHSVTTTTTTVTRTITPIGPVASTAQGLKRFSDSLQQPIYWAGPEKGYTYELTETIDGNVYVRYLPAGVEVGDPRANFLIVATYPYSNALGALKAVANGGGRTLSGGVFALPDKAYPKSVHLAYPKVDYQIEVYDPSPAYAKQVAFSGNVRPVG